MSEAEPSAEGRDLSFLSDSPRDRRIPITINWELAAYGSLIALALVLRFWDLGSRMLHHDESLRAVYAWQLYIGQGYKHDPMMHGPFLFDLGALAYFLLGASDATARIAPALFGAALVGLPYFLRGHLGRSGALVAAAFLTISPSFLYFSRFQRHDIYITVWSVCLVILMFKHFQQPRKIYLYLLAAVLSLSFSTKEDTYITLAILGIYLLATNGFDFLNIFRRNAAFTPQTDVLILFGTFLLPLMSGFAVAAERFLKFAPLSAGEITFLAAVFLVLLALSALLGLRWNARVWLWCALIFWGIFFTLHTTFFTNPDGAATGAVGPLKYWIEQQGVKRGDQPWFYYLVLIPLYEFVPVIFGLAAMVYFSVRRNLFAIFLVFWTVLAFLLYGWAAEKMPWLMLHMVLPLILAAAMSIGKLIDCIVARRHLGSKALYYGASILVLLFVASALWNRFIARAAPGQPIERLQQSLEFLAIALIFIGLLALSIKLGWEIGRNFALHVAAIVVLLGLMALTVRAAWQVNYYNGDLPVEMMVYTQTSPDVGKVMKEIERVGFRTGTGKDLKIAYDNEVSWPFEWYLRDFRNRAFYGGGMPATDAPVVLVGFDNDHDAKVKPVLTNYVGQRYKLRAWYPEDYRGITPNGILKAILDQDMRTKLWNYFMYRQTLNPPGSTDFALYVRRDLVEGAWSFTAGGAAVQAPPAATNLSTQPIPNPQVWGTKGLGPGQFQTPKGIAVGPDGSIFVLDTGNNRVQKFSEDAGFLATWGKLGPGEGEFNEPWGIATDAKGNVYVADTWNHRIQKFDSDGKFLSQWGGYASGSPDIAAGKFYGPRSIAIDPSGYVYVADTGNHRVQKFDAVGEPVAAFGQRGTGKGQFSEPVGLAIAADGTVLVADTWNHRVQRLTPDLSPAGEWMIVGWESNSVTNKPFLAADAKGRIFATDPDNNRVFQFDNGALVKVFGRTGETGGPMGLPTGVAMDAKGRVLVVDSLNNRVIRFAIGD